MKTAGAVVLAPELAARVREAVEQRGQRLAREALGLTPETLARVLGGLPVRRGTMALIEQRLAELAGGQAA